MLSCRRQRQRYVTLASTHLWGVLTRNRPQNWQNTPLVALHTVAGSGADQTTLLPIPIVRQRLRHILRRAQLLREELEVGQLRAQDAGTQGGGFLPPTHSPPTGGDLGSRFWGINFRRSTDSRCFISGGASRT